MLIASKYHEINPPVVDDFTYITDNSYTRDQILAQECQLLSVLGFDVAFPTSYTFLERFIQLGNISRDTEAQLFSKYLCELTLLETKMLKWQPSLIANAAVFLAKKILRRPEPWCLAFKECSGYSERQVRDCAREICISLNTKKHNYESLYKKYATSKFGRVALIPERLTSGFQSP